MPLFTHEIIALSSGLLAHHLIFIHGEWHLRAPMVVVVHLMLGLGMYILCLWENNFQVSKALFDATKFNLCYLLSLFSSISCYRLFFHRLRHFPGPRMAGLTKLWHVWKCRDSRGHHVLSALHEQYGAFVRTGPSEITIIHPAAHEAMDGPGNRNIRSDWYDLMHPRNSLLLMRDRASHSRRRKIWEHSLSMKALVHYQDKILRHVRAFDEVIAARGTRPIVINDYMYFYTFDSMGDFAFGEMFGMMKSGEWHQALAMFRSGMTLLGPFSPAVWIPRIGFTLLPGLRKVRDWLGMLSFCDECMKKRRMQKPEEKDIASWLIESYDANPNRKERELWLSGETATLVLAGSDTTAPTLTILFYFLARYPEHAERIYEELKSIDVNNANALAKLPHLNGTINESMRLFPVILTGTSRMTPPEGLTVDGTFIPGEIKLCAPRYTIGRLQAAYDQPHEFIPERWYSRPEMIRDKRAFAPFGLGQTSCVGKNLALIQVRLVTASLLSKYRFEFAPGTDQGKAFERDMRDQLTANPGSCSLVFHQRP